MLGGSACEQAHISPILNSNIMGSPPFVDNLLKTKTSACTQKYQLAHILNLFWQTPVRGSLTRCQFFFRGGFAS